MGDLGDYAVVGGGCYYKYGSDYDEEDTTMAKACDINAAVTKNFPGVEVTFNGSTIKVEDTRFTEVSDGYDTYLKAVGFYNGRRVVERYIVSWYDTSYDKGNAQNTINSIVDAIWMFLVHHYRKGWRGDTPLSKLVAERRAAQAKESQPQSDFMKKPVVMGDLPKTATWATKK